MTVRLSIIVPTIGRPTLRQTLRSIESQLEDGDELILVHDHEVEPILGRGNAERREGMRRATGTHLAFMDDDDIYTPGALDLMREHADLERPVIFRADVSHLRGGVIWHEPVLRYTNVSTQMFLVPNEPDLLGEWAPHEENGSRGLPAGSDFTFIVGCCERMGPPIWRSEIISVLRPSLAVAV